MKKIILFFSLSVLLFSGNIKNIKDGWQSIDLDNINIYLKNNKGSAMGQFGIIKRKDVCTFTTFYIAISSFDKDLLKFDGKNISLIFKANNVQVNISVSVIAYNIDKKSSIYQVISSNFVPTIKFLNLLKNSKKLTISADKNDKIYKYLDVKKFTYDLKGFKYILDLGYNECIENLVK
jgi:hypothetical protein